MTALEQAAMEAAADRIAAALVRIQDEGFRTVVAEDAAAPSWVLFHVDGAFKWGWVEHADSGGRTDVHEFEALLTLLDDFRSLSEPS